MKVIPFNVKNHTDRLHRMLLSRGMPIEQEYPEFGMSAIENDVLVAVGFVRRVEGNHAIIDSFITNAECSSEVRQRALQLLCYKIDNILRSVKLNKLLILTTDLDIVQRAHQNGFKLIPHLILVR